MRYWIKERNDKRGSATLLKQLMSEDQFEYRIAMRMTALATNYKTTTPSQRQAFLTVLERYWIGRSHEPCSTGMGALDQKDDCQSVTLTGIEQFHSSSVSH